MSITTLVLSSSDPVNPKKITTIFAHRKIKNVRRGLVYISQQYFSEMEIVSLTPDEARHVATALTTAANRAEGKAL